MSVSGNSAVNKEPTPSPIKPPPPSPLTQFFTSLSQFFQKIGAWFSSLIGRKVVDITSEAQIEQRIGWLNSIATEIRKNIHIEGIFRVSGKAVRVGELYKLLKEGHPLPKKEPIENLATLFKKIVREGLNKQNNQKICEDKSQEINKKLFDSLEGKEQLKVVFSLLKAIADGSNKNKMTPSNLAVCFAPIYAEVGEDSMINLNNNPRAQKFIVTVLENYEQFFPEEGRGMVELSGDTLLITSRMFQGGDSHE